MVKVSEAASERQAAIALGNLLASVPVVEVDQIEREVKAANGRRPDIVASVRLRGERLLIVAEVKANGQPKIVREAARQARVQAEGFEGSTVPMVIAPYLSEQAQDVCGQEQVAYLDLLGNCRLVAGGLYVERRTDGRPEPERRALRTLFKPKSARVLRSLLRTPHRRWRVVELANDAGVSLGLVSNVGAALRERDWAEQDDEGLFLVDPDRLLDAWADDYAPPRGEEVRLYTHFHGKQLTDRLGALSLQNGRVAFASYSAAEWLAPYARHSTSYFYADELGLGALQTELQLSAPPRGPNVTITVPDDDGVLRDAEPVAPGLVATSPVQTYLDLMRAGERGQEAARHLRAERLQWRP